MPISKHISLIFLLSLGASTAYGCEAAPQAVPQAKPSATLDLPMYVDVLAFCKKPVPQNVMELIETEYATNRNLVDYAQLGQDTAVTLINACKKLFQDYKANEQLLHACLKSPLRLGIELVSLLD